jgi:hypothetical protein
MNWRVRIFFILMATFSFTLIEGEMGKSHFVATPHNPHALSEQSAH